MITPNQYFLEKIHTTQQDTNANKLLSSVNSLLYDAALAGAYNYQIDPDTNSQISGAKGGYGDGGYRLPDSSTGASKSAHKDANACDICDPDRKLAAWCILNQDELDKHGLWMEDPRWTPVWTHFQRVPPRSGKRVYIPSTNSPIAEALPGQTVARPIRIKT